MLHTWPVMISCPSLYPHVTFPSPLVSLGFSESSVGKESVCNAADTSSILGSGRSTGEGIDYPLQYSWASFVAQLVKKPPGMQETWVRSLGWEDPLEKGKATHSSILAWRIPWTVQSRGRKESDTTEQLSLTYLLRHDKYLHAKFFTKL